MHITLYRKYRPSKFEEVAGETEIIKTIRSSLKSGKLAHAYLFTGPRGCGKTTVARLIAKGVNCLTNGITDSPCNICDNCKNISDGTFMDMVEIDAASNRGIDEIRELKDKINYQPAKGRKKVYIIDEVHMLTKEAFNALLKTLEEPPEHVIFILATTEPEKILPTIISRCQRYDFKIFTLNEMQPRLRYIADQEEINILDEAIEVIYEASGGSMRDAISILERVCMNYLEDEIDREKVEEILGITSGKKMLIFIEYLKNNNKKGAVEFLNEIWRESVDVEIFFKDLAKLVRNLIEKNQFSLDLGIKVIGAIYSTISKFKFEEDKRLVGYVIIDELYTVLPQEKIEIVVPKIEKKQELPIKNEYHYIDKNEKKITLKEINDNWELAIKNVKKEKISLIAFLINAKPIRVEKNTLTVQFSSENAFSEQQMKKSSNNEIFQNVFSEILGQNILINYEIKNKTSNSSQNKKIENFADQIVNFFGGDIIED